MVEIKAEFLIISIVSFTKDGSVFHIKLPQVLRKTLPSLVNETFHIIKNSALISTIAVTDLMRIVQSYSSTTYRPLEFFITAGALYLILTCTVSYVGKRIEQKLIQHQGA